MSTQQGNTRKVRNPLKETSANQRSNKAGSQSKPSVTVCDDLQQRIAARAYELYEGRGCGHGYALDDWIRAEREVLS